MVPLIATTSGAALSPQAAKLLPLQPVPSGPRALPLIGNVLAMKGPYEAPGYNLWHNVFTPEKQALWGDTVRLYLPPGMLADSVEALADDASVLQATVVTCDPEVSDGGPQSTKAGPKKATSQHGVRSGG